MAQIVTKSEGGRVSKTLDRHPKVLCYDTEGTDPGHYMMTLVKGWAFDDANIDNMASHCQANTVTELVERMRWASPCSCSRCTGKEA